MTKIEEVARAIAGQFAQSADLWEDFVDTAHVAIKAMREPTEAMVDAGAEYAPGAGDARDAWHAMIDAALAE